MHGAGVLIDERHVLTCAHVFAEAANLPNGDRSSAPSPDVVVSVDFPFVPTAGIGPASVAAGGWLPVGPDESGDIAVLELRQPAFGAKPAPLRRPNQMAGHPFSVHGFPGQAGAGRAGLNAAARQARGRIEAASGPTGQWVQLSATSAAGHQIDYGFSGAPVWDERVQAVVGICALRDVHRTGHVITLDYVSAFWRPLARWRLDPDGLDELTYWLPRARGVAPEAAGGAEGWLFSGRGVELTSLTSWLAEPDQPPVAIVTGVPGSGKTALLSCLLLASDPGMAGDVPDILGWVNRPDLPVAVFDVAIRATGLTIADVIRRLAVAADLNADLNDATRLAIALQGRAESFTALVDGIDEAKTARDADQIAAMLTALAAQDSPLARRRILVGLRSAPPGSAQARRMEMFGLDPFVIDLAGSDHRDDDAVRDYARRLLLVDSASHRSPYHDIAAGELAATARAITARADSNFLITQLTCRWLALKAEAAPAGRTEFPRTVAAALDNYLNACELHVPGVRDLLRPLAFARGAGLPRTQEWVDLANALARGAAFTTRTLQRVFDSAASYLVDRGSDDAEPTYRLFHQTLDEYLRAGCRNTQPDAAIATALLRRVPLRGDRRQWPNASRYTRDHLADHATAAGMLDELVRDAGFLVYSSVPAVLSGLDTISSPAGREAAAVYRTSLHLHAETDAAARRQILALDAARWGAFDLLAELNRLDLDDGFPWLVTAATGGMIDPAHIATISGYTDLQRGYGVEAVALGDLDRMPIAVTGGGDGTVRVLDLRRFGEAEVPMIGSTGDEVGSAVNTIAIGELDGVPVAVTGGRDGTVRVFDLRRRRQARPPMIGSAGDEADSGVNALALGELDGVPVAVTGGDDGTVRVFDLREGAQFGDPMFCFPEPPDERLPLRMSVRSVAFCRVDGVPVAVSGCADLTVRVWDLRSHTQVGDPMTAQSPTAVGRTRGHVSAMAVADHHGVPIAVCGEVGGAVRVWDLRRRVEFAAAFQAHPGCEVTGVAITMVGSTPVFVTSTADDGRVMAWDLDTRRAVRPPIFAGHSSSVMAVAARPVSGVSLMVTGGHDGTVGIWDLGRATTPARRHIVHRRDVTAAAIDDTGEITVAITADGGGEVCVWRQAPHDLTVERSEAHQAWTATAAIGNVGGAQFGITTGDDGSGAVWSLDEQTDDRADFLAEHGLSISTAPIPGTGGTSIAVLADKDQQPPGRDQGLWLYTPFTDIDEVSLPSDPVMTAASLMVDRTPIAITGTMRGFVQLWDLKTRTPLTEAVRGHVEVSATATDMIDGRPVGITAGYEGALLIWDLRGGNLARPPLTRHGCRVTALATGTLHGTPVALSGDQEGNVLLWDLRRGTALSGMTLPATIGAIALSRSNALIIGFGADVVWLTPRVLASVTSLSPPPAILTPRSMRLPRDAGEPIAPDTRLDMLPGKDEITRLWRLAADLGDTAAMHNLGDLHMRQGETQPALHWYQAAAAGGETRSMCAIATWHEDRDEPDAAAPYWQRAADAGVPGAMVVLAGKLMSRGEHWQALGLVEQAAWSGSVTAMNMLAQFYWDSDLLDQAQQWYAQGAARGQASAMRGLANCLERRGDQDGARQWRVRAARYSDEPAGSDD